MSELNRILHKHGVWTLSEFQQHVDDGDAELEHDLFEYYSGTGQMPYGTMKARTGDPGQWIYDETVKYLETAYDQQT